MTASDFNLVYLPVGVGTFHMESARDVYERSMATLDELGLSLLRPDDTLLSVDAVRAYLEGLPCAPSALVFQNVTFCNAAYIRQVLSLVDCPVCLWAVREPVADGSRLRLNSLTGAFSAGNTYRAMRGGEPGFVLGSPEEETVREGLRAFINAARTKDRMSCLRILTVGEPPEGFDFGHADNGELARVFGACQVRHSVEELIGLAEAMEVGAVDEARDRSAREIVGFSSQTPEDKQIRHSMLLAAYEQLVAEEGAGAVASRCWPNYFVDYGAPVCAVLSMLGAEGVPAACETDAWGALSMWIGQELSGYPAFFGDPASMDEGENTVTFWHCGMAACSLARTDTGATVGVHPNRKMGPAMDFGCEPWPRGTILRVGRKPDGSFRLVCAEGEILDKPKQFQGTSVVVRTDCKARDWVEWGVRNGMEPHYVVIRGAHAAALRELAVMCGVEFVRL